MYTLQKPQGWWSVVWDGKKLGFLHMLMCSFVHFHFVCEHLFTFQFCALMPEISKENFAGNLQRKLAKTVGESTKKTGQNWSNFLSNSPKELARTLWESSTKTVHNCERIYQENWLELSRNLQRTRTRTSKKTGQDCGGIYQEN